MQGHYSPLSVFSLQPRDAKSNFYGCYRKTQQLLILSSDKFMLFTELVLQELNGKCCTVVLIPFLGGMWDKPGTE